MQVAEQPAIIAEFSEDTHKGGGLKSPAAIFLFN